MSFPGQYVGIPGVGSDVTSTPRIIFRDGTVNGYFSQGRYINGSLSRDTGNTGDLGVLRPGLLMGQISATGFYAPAVIGTVGTAYASGTSLVVNNAATGTEIVRRIGATGTFKITGPPTANGTVRTQTVTYSAVSSDSITITALPVADVWTLTAPAGQDAGTYQLEITTGKGTSAEVVATTVALAAAANSATVDAALEALTNVGVAGVAAVYSDPTLTLTFAAALGPVHVRVVSDTTNDGGVFEGGWAAVHTTTGVDGRFVAGSLIQPTDGSEIIKTFIPDGLNAFGLKVVDDAGVSVAQVPFPHMPIAGVVDSSQFLPAWPSDTSLQAHIVAALRAAGVAYGFDHLL